MARAARRMKAVGTAAKAHRASYCVVGVVGYRWWSCQHGTKLTLPDETEAGCGDATVLRDNPVGSSSR